MDNLITWVYEDGSFVPSTKVQNGETYSIVSDYIGRPVQAYDNTGSLVWSTEYDIYGKLRNLKGSSSFIPFRQLGQYEDEELEGLYYNRFRYYDCNTGSYISKDPIGLMGHNPNLYAYVKNSNNWIDIFGLDPIKIRPSDLSGGVYAPDATLNQALSRAARSGDPQGQWLSEDAIYKTADKYDFSKGGVQVVDIDKGDGHVVHNPVGSYPELPKGEKTYLIVPAERAIIIPKEDWLHLFPIDETHPQFKSNYH